MTPKPKPATSTFLLGIDGGGTRTVAIMADSGLNLMKRIEAGPSNLRLLSDAELAHHFTQIAAQFPEPAALGIGLAGVRNAKDEERVKQAAALAWPGAPCRATHDLETALAAAEAPGDPVGAKVIVLSGTGSCCYGRNLRDETAKIGGWGHLIGDKASGYEIGLRALKAIVYYFDRDREWSRLGQGILRRLLLNEPDDLIAWAQAAPKKEMAGLAVQVFEAWEEGDRIAADILEGASASLAKDAVACARRLAEPTAPVLFALAGGVLLRQPRFGEKVAAKIREKWPTAKVVPLPNEGAWGAVKMAAALSQESVPLKKPAKKAKRSKAAATAKFDPREAIPEGARLSPTEQRNPKSMNLHRMSIPAGVLLMLNEEEEVRKALLAQKGKIARAVRMVAEALRRGGRLFYVGAGTSGRLGVLDSSECPPTFRTPPELVQGIMAGGATALWQSVEGAEDDAEAGAKSIEFRGVGPADIVVGIAASGRTPFVWGALREARERGASTVLLAFNPFLKFSPAFKPDLVIAPNLGPEILTGSTRLKAGTATKLVLNILTTLSMVQLGKVASNLMVDLNPSNVKLRDRAVRIVRELAGCGEADALRALEESDWVVKEAWKKLSAQDPV